METGGEVRDRETDGGDEDTKRKRRRRRRTRNEEEGTRSLRVLAVYFVIAGAYAGINVTNFDDLHAHTHSNAVRQLLPARLSAIFHRSNASGAHRSRD